MSDGDGAKLYNLVLNSAIKYFSLIYNFYEIIKVMSLHGYWIDCKMFTKYLTV